MTMMIVERVEDHHERRLHRLEEGTFGQLFLRLRQSIGRVRGAETAINLESQKPQSPRTATGYASYNRHYGRHVLRRLLPRSAGQILLAQPVQCMPSGITR